MSDDASPGRHLDCEGCVSRGCLARWTVSKLMHNLTLGAVGAVRALDADDAAAVGARPVRDGVRR
jgi:hypothetical protein